MDVYYLFNFISDKEKADILEFMEEKADHTYFGIYTPDQFEYVHNLDFEKMLPVENISPEPEKKRGFFNRKREKRRKNGKISK